MSRRVITNELITVIDASNIITCPSPRLTAVDAILPPSSARRLLYFQVRSTPIMWVVRLFHPVMPLLPSHASDTMAGGKTLQAGDGARSQEFQTTEATLKEVFRSQLQGLEATFQELLEMKTLALSETRLETPTVSSCHSHTRSSNLPRYSL